MGLCNVDVGNLVCSGDIELLVIIIQIMLISVLFIVFELDLLVVVVVVCIIFQFIVEVWDCEECQVFGDGVLFSLDNCIDIVIGMLKLCVQFVNVDEILFFNQFVNICLQVSSSDVVVIFNVVVQFGSKGIYVYVIVVDDILYLCNVVFGFVDGECVLVCEGFRVGEWVVVEGIDGLCEGVKVEVVVQDLVWIGV